MSAESDELLGKVGEASAAACWPCDPSAGYIEIGRAALKALMGVDGSGKCSPQCRFHVWDDDYGGSCNLGLDAQALGSWDRLPGPDCPMYEKGGGG